MKPHAAILSKICFEDVHLFQSNWSLLKKKKNKLDTMGVLHLFTQNLILEKN